jgi:hypothetical protein
VSPPAEPGVYTGSIILNLLVNNPYLTERNVNGKYSRISGKIKRVSNQSSSYWEVKDRCGSPRRNLGTGKKGRD